MKDFVGCQVINKLEHGYISEAIKRLLPNRNIEILGSKTADRQAILSFLVYSTTNAPLPATANAPQGRYYMWGEVGNARDKPLHGAFVATLLNDLFGIQARGGCACAGPYGHALLGIDETRSLAIRSAIEKVSIYPESLSHKSQPYKRLFHSIQLSVCEVGVWCRQESNLLCKQWTETR